MKASIARLDAFYEVAFSRPAFSCASTFAQIIGPIYDALSGEFLIPDDAIRLESGNTLATAFVAISLNSPNCIFEVRLNGYKAHFFDVGSSDNVDRAKRSVKRFEVATSTFLHDGWPGIWRLTVPFWLAVEGGAEATEDIIRKFTGCPDDRDPLEIGSTATRSMARFECSNEEEVWSVSVFLHRAVLPSADLFFDISAEYGRRSYYRDFDKKVEHLTYVSGTICNKLGLIVE